MVKVFTTDESGRISFTKEELEKLLEEAYNEGKANANTVYVPSITNNKNWWETQPVWTSTTATAASDKEVTIN